jgi:hypothetical protein
MPVDSILCGPELGSLSSAAAAVHLSLTHSLVRFIYTTDMQNVRHAADMDRVRANTETTINDRIDAETEYRLLQFANEPSASVSGRLEELDGEWDLERVLETEASSIGLAGLILAFFVSKRFLLLPGVVSTMVFLHATQGWYPLLPIFRRLGLRTRNEIDRERYALKALRGDFAEVGSAESAARARAAWHAVLA